jgi:hypothetical protein
MHCNQIIENWNWVSFVLTQLSYILRHINDIEIVTYATLVFEVRSGCWESGHICIEVASPLRPVWGLLSLRNAFWSRPQLSLLGECVRRKDSLSYEGEFLLSMSYPDAQRFMSESIDTNSIKYRYILSLILGSFTEHQNFLRSIHRCMYFMITFLEKFYWKVWRRNTSSVVGK